MKTLLLLILGVGVIVFGWRWRSGAENDSKPGERDLISEGVSNLSPRALPGDAGYNAAEDSGEVVSKPVPPSAITQLTNVEKDKTLSLESLSAGDTVGENLTVQSIGAYSETDPLSEQYPPGPKNHVLSLNGELTLSGVYIHYSLEQQEVDGKLSFVHFQLDEPSRKRIPSLYGRERNFLYFTNSDFAKENFPEPGSSGTATVVLRNYKIREFPPVSTDTAELIRVVKTYE